MKRFLSIILALTMIFSTVAFAAPVMVGTTETASEATEIIIDAADEAIVMDDAADANIYDSKYGLLVAKMDFEGIADDTVISNKANVANFGYVASTLPDGFPAVIGVYNSYLGSKYTVKTDEEGNKYGYVEKAQDFGWSKAGFRGFEDNGTTAKAFPAGTYTIKAEIKYLQKNGVDVTEATEVDSYTSTTFLAKVDDAFGEERNYQTCQKETTTHSKIHWTIAHTYSFLDGVEYSTNSGELTEFAGIGAISTMSNAGKTNKYAVAFDNIELYYKAPVTVSFNNGGERNAVLVGDGLFGDEDSFKINIGADLDTTKYSFTNTSSKLFKGWTDANGNHLSGTINPTEDITLTAVWEDAYSEDYGMLIAAVDFDKLKIGTTFTSNNQRDYNVKDYGVVADELPEGFPSDIYVTFYGNGASVVGTDTDKYCSLYSVKNSGEGKQSWPRISFMTLNETGDHLFKATGTYTMIWTLKQDTENSVYTTIDSQSNTYVWNGTKYNEVNKGFNNNYINDITDGLKSGWKSSRAVISILDGENITTDIGAFKGFGAFQAMPTVTCSDEAFVGTKTNDKGATVNLYSYTNYTLIDDVKLYYKAPVNVTYVDTKGYSEQSSQTVTVKNGIAFNLPKPTTTKANTNFVGWSYKENGNVIAADTLTITEDTTLYAVWAEVENHPEYGKTIFSIDFENSTDFSSNKLYKHGYVNADDETATTWTMGGSQLTSNSYAIYGENKDGVIVYKNGEIVKTEGVTDYEVVNKFLGANGGTGTNPQFSPNTGYNGTSNFTVFAPKGYFTLSSRGAYDKHEDSTHTISDNLGYQFRHYTHYWTDKAAGTTDFKHDSTIGIKDIINEKAGNNIWKTKLATTSSNTEFDDTKITISGSEYEVLKTDSVSAYLVYFTYSNRTANSVNDLFKIDDVVMYWKPFTANITIDMNGNEDKTVDAYVHDTIAQLDLVKLAEHVGDTKNYKLLGFSATEDGDILDENFWANEDMTLYAVWEEKNDVTPVSSNLSSIRTNGVNGIRFMASVTEAQKTEIEEYGFIVTLKTLLGDKQLTHAVKDEGVSIVTGVNYNKAEGKDLIYRTEASTVYFTAVVHGIPESKANYEAKFVVRPYSKRGDYYYYGEAVEKSVLEIAEAIRDNNYEGFNDTDKEFVNKILSVCEKATAAE